MYAIRSYYVVAHVGQKVGLDAGGLLRQLLGLGHLGLRLLLGRDVDEGADHPTRLAVGLAEGGDPIEGLVQQTVGKGRLGFV